ncbi:helix-turn-helix domain-containing protein, partial [Azospirillum sp. B4]|uniref:helix-turn-helix domain-containing protein n=1 Tax=Azospirillum sp. B4 TaxID=95605 RepID=UPI0019018335
MDHGHQPPGVDAVADRIDVPRRFHVTLNRPGQGGPRGQAKGRPHSGPGGYKAAAAASDFTGLPEGYAHPRQLLRPILEAGRRSGLCPGAINTLTVIVEATDRRSWVAGGMPSCSVSNDRLALSAGSLPTVTRHIRQLREVGALQVHYGENNRRHPIRDNSGGIVVFMGFDLRPLVSFAMACRRVAQQQVELQKRIVFLAGEVTGLTLAIEEHLVSLEIRLGQATPTSLDGAAGAGVSLEELQSIRRETRNLRSRFARSSDEAQQRIQQRLRDLVDNLRSQEEALRD